MFKNRAIIILSTIIALVVFVEPAHAFMSSDSFRIWADTVSSGGNRSTSTSFIAQDSIGENANGENMSSASFLAQAGLPAIFQEPVLLMTISVSALTLSPSPITASAVSTGSYTVTISTDASAGYTLTATEDTDFQFSAGVFIPDVTDGSVTVGAGEYGVAVSGTDASFSDDRALGTTALTVASRTSRTTSSVDTITHRVGVSGSSTVGVYAHTVTYLVMGNY